MGTDRAHKNKARKLTKEGFCTLTLDIYGEGYRGETALASAEQMNQLYSDMKNTSKRVKFGWEYLKSLDQVDETKTAVIGYCLGGALSLHLARMGADVQAVVSFHGKLALLDSIHKAQNIKAKVLVCHGAEDSMVTETEVQGFKQKWIKRG